MLEPGYISLYKSGELEHRTQALKARLSNCDLCPKKCHINRLKDEHPK